jgi:hypothetical protein
MNAGLAGLAFIGVGAIAGLKFEDVEPLMDEMFASCVAIVPDPARPSVFRGAGRLEGGAGPVGPMVEDDIEEVSTLLQLRKAILELHLGFSLAVDPSGSAAPDPKTTGNMPTT